MHLFGAAGLDATGVDGAGVDAAGVDAAGVDGAGLDATGVDATGSTHPIVGFDGRQEQACAVGVKIGLMRCDNVTARRPACRFGRFTPPGSV